MSQPTPAPLDAIRQRHIADDVFELRGGTLHAPNVHRDRGVLLAVCEAQQQEIETLKQGNANLKSWVPLCKNCKRPITRIDMPAPEGPDRKGQHGWLHVSPSGVFCPPDFVDGRLLQPTVEPDDSLICRMWETLDEQRRKSEAALTVLREQLHQIRFQIQGFRVGDRLVSTDTFLEQLEAALAGADLRASQLITNRCEGRYPVPQTAPPRAEPFEVTYRCALPTGHTGPHGADLSRCSRGAVDARQRPD